MAKRFCSSSGGDHRRILIIAVIVIVINDQSYNTLNPKIIGSGHGALKASQTVGAANVLTIPH